MELRTKKIIAKEIIYLAVTLCLLVITLLAVNQYCKNNNIKINERIKIINAAIDSIEIEVDSLSELSIGIHNVRHGFNMECSRAYRKKYNIGLDDAFAGIAERIDIDGGAQKYWNSRVQWVIDLFHEQGIESPQQLEQFINEHSNNRTSGLIAQIKECQEEAKLLFKEKREEYKNLIDKKESRSLLYKNFLWIIIVLYPIRLLIKGVVWSLKILRN